jgi:hypothetical protein
MKAFSNTSLLVPGDPGRLGTLIYIVTVETSRPGQARHTYLRSYCGNLKNVCVCISYFLMVPVFSLVVSVIYHLPIRKTEFCVLSSPAIWWRSVELQRSG